MCELEDASYRRGTCRFRVDLQAKRAGRRNRHGEADAKPSRDKLV